MGLPTLQKVDIYGVFLVMCYATLHPALSVRWSVRWSITLYSFFFWFFCGLWPHCSCSNDLVTSIMTPAHPHVTGVAQYLALFFIFFLLSLFFLEEISVRQLWCPNKRYCHGSSGDIVPNAPGRGKRFAKDLQQTHRVSFSIA